MDPKRAAGRTRAPALAVDEPLGTETRLCVDIGATHVRVALADGSRIAQFVERRISELLAEDPGDIVIPVAHLIEKVLASPPASWGSALPPIGLGVADMVLEGGSLRIGLSAGIPAGTALRDRLSERFGTTVVVDNDASMAALGESIYGAGKGERVLALLSLGSNIGMGIVVDGRIYRGVHGAAGEIGTVPVRLDKSDHGRWKLVTAARRDQSRSRYPPGDYVWLEELYGGRALSNAWRASTTARRPHGPSTSIHVLQLAAAGDAVAQQLVTEAVGGWALAIATTCGTVDPGAVLIGGGIAEDIGPYLDPLCRLVDELVPGRAPRIEVANLASLAGLIGAAVAARHSTTAQGLPTPGGSVIRHGAQVSSAKSLNE